MVKQRPLNERKTAHGPANPIRADGSGARAELLMLAHQYLQFDAKPEKPDPVYAHKLQELISSGYGV